jgi:hypothetical protein
MVTERPANGNADANMIDPLASPAAAGAIAI